MIHKKSSHHVRICIIYKYSIADFLSDKTRRFSISGELLTQGFEAAIEQEVKRG
jgi:hypothetical protein